MNLPTTGSSRRLIRLRWWAATRGFCGGVAASVVGGAVGQLTENTLIAAAAATAVGLFVACALWWAASKAEVSWGSTGIVSRSAFRTRRVPWEEVECLQRFHAHGITTLDVRGVSQEGSFQLAGTSSWSMLWWQRRLLEQSLQYACHAHTGRSLNVQES